MAEERAPLTTPAATLVYTVSSESWVCGEKEGGERGEGKEEREERRREGGEKEKKRGRRGGKAITSLQ